MAPATSRAKNLRKGGKTLTRIAFHQKLERLRDRLLEMAGLAVQTLRFAMDAQSLGELAACSKVRSNEVAINTAEREVDQMALDLLAMEQPMAGDLRFILAAIKINSELERIGDQAMSIALLAEEQAQGQPCALPVDIPHMAELSIAMLRTALEALATSDAELAASVLSMDDSVDDMNRRFKNILLQCIAEDSTAASPAVNLLFIARSLERIADHATNMAEDVIFWVRGADVRHGWELGSQAS
ncbi:MAG TPA: phosphate signaling complex protein PhoU [Acidobacteriaceae bacterium]